MEKLKNGRLEKFYHGGTKDNEKEELRSEGMEGWKIGKMEKLDN